MASASPFHVRDLEGPKDVKFLIEAFDASLPQLASIGSGGQWGSQPFSERPTTKDRIKIFEQALRYQLTGEGDPIRLFIIEAEIPSSAVDELPEPVHIRTDDAGKKFLAVGSMMLSEGMYPHYVGRHFDNDAIRKELDGTRDYLYLEALITDFRTGPWRKGAGAALIEYARQYCREKGKPILYGDCYSGNNRKLVKYYETQGFFVIDYFDAPTPDGSVWPGALFRMDVPL